VNNPGYVLGAQTLGAFQDAFTKNGFDLTTPGVNAFKVANGLSNTGVLEGVIGATTANVYATKLLAVLTVPPGPRAINAAGLALIEEFEGCAQILASGDVAAYLDAVGVPTIGYGHTAGVYMGLVVTRAQVDQYLAEDLNEFETGVSSCVTVPITDNQFAALVSFTYNLGLATLQNSAMLAQLNAGAPLSQVAAHFGNYVSAGGQVLTGLVRRRAAEQALFLS